MENILPIHSEIVPSGFQPYVLDALEGGLVDEDIGKALCFVVMKREHGLLLAVPYGLIPRDVLALGSQAELLDVVGPSLEVAVASALFQEESLLLDPVLEDGQKIPVLLLDVSSVVVAGLQEVVEFSEIQDVVGFDLDDVSRVPLPADLVAAAIGWSMEPGPASTERLQFYSADETAPDGPATPPASRAPKRRGDTPSGTGKGGKPTPQKKRPTVASVAESVESLVNMLPTITAQLQDLSSRTAAIEAANRPDHRLSALRQQLGKSTMPGSWQSATLGSLVKEMPPPKSSSAHLKSPQMLLQKESQELLEEAAGEEASSDLARAVLEQSRVLTTLVGQIASSSDTFPDFGAVGVTSSKGAAGRAKLQAELAMHKGTFFESVLRSMARRMNPAVSTEVSMSVLAD